MGGGGSGGVARPVRYAALHTCLNPEQAPLHLSELVVDAFIHPVASVRSAFPVTAGVQR